MEGAMKKRAKFFAGITAGVFLFGLLSCDRPRAIRLAVAGPLTGPQSAIGQEVLNGATLAADEWNVAGGVRGRKIEIFSEDDADSPLKAAEVAEAIASRHPLFVVGHVDSGCSLATAPIYKAHGIVMISPTATHTQLTDAPDLGAFRVCGRDDAQGKAAAVWLTTHAPGHRIAVVHAPSDYGRGLSDEFTKALEFLTGSGVVLHEELPGSVSKFEDLVAKVKAAQPEIIYFGGVESEGGGLVKALRAAGIEAQFMSGDGCFGPAFIAASGPEAAEGALVTFYPDPAKSSSADVMAFRGAYLQKFGAEPGPFGVYGYMAAQVGLTAVSKAVTPISARTIRDALHREVFPTVYGPIRFNDKGDRTDVRYTIWQVSQGKFIEVSN
jgi:branched-chain amino acid transport system substrate-binding protein